MTRRTDEENKRIYEDVYSQQPLYGCASPGRAEMMERACVPRIPRGCTIVDVGGGTYDFVKRLVESGHVKRGVVLDLAQAAVNHQLSMGVEAVCGSVNALPFADNEFDIVTSFDVLEHLEPEDIDNAISEICRVAKSLVMIAVSPVPCPHLGYELHRTIKSNDWWKKKLAEFGPLEFEWYSGVPNHFMMFLIPPGSQYKFTHEEESIYERLHSGMYDTPQNEYGKTSYHAFGAERLIKPGSSVLDVGAGRTPWLANTKLSHDLSMAVCTDISSHAVEYQNTCLGIAAFECDIQKMPFSDNEFDVVTCFGVIEHLHEDEIEPAINEMLRIAKARVILFMGTGSSVWEGTELHLTQKTDEEWIVFFSKISSVKTDGKFLILTNPED